MAEEQESGSTQLFASLAFMIDRNQSMMFSCPRCTRPLSAFSAQQTIGKHSAPNGSYCDESGAPLPSGVSAGLSRDVWKSKPRWGICPTCGGNFEMRNDVRIVPSHKNARQRHCSGSGKNPKGVNYGPLVRRKLPGSSSVPDIPGGAPGLGKRS